MSDFGAGTNSGTAVTSEGDGEVRLAPALAEEFSGSAVDEAVWTSKSWVSEGGGPSSSTISSGVLSMTGTAMLSAQSFVNSPVEGRISFGAEPYQHFGLATSFDSAAGNYWALFSTWGTTNTLYARVNANGSATDVWLGALPAGFHTYKIQPTAAGFDFYIDGALRTSIAASFQTSVSMRAGISAFNASSPIQVDSVHYNTYAANQSGTFTSVAFDAAQP